jgi:Ca2+-transporting ATPase
MILHPTALLVFQELPAGDLQPATRGAGARFFSRREWAAIALVGALTALVVIGAYVWNVRESGQAEHGRAMAIATLAFASAALTARLSGLRTRTARIIAAATIGSTIIMIQTPLLAGVLHLEPLHPMDWSVAIAGGVLAAALSRELALRPAPVR